MPHRVAEFQELCRECNARTVARCTCCATPLCAGHLDPRGWCRACDSEVRRRLRVAAAHPRMVALIVPGIIAVCLAFVALASASGDGGSRLLTLAYFPVSVLGGVWIWRHALARERAKFLRERSRLG